MVAASLEQRTCLVAQWAGQYWREKSFHNKKHFARIIQPIDGLDQYRCPKVQFPKEVEQKVFRQYNALKFGLATGRLMEGYEVQLRDLRNFIGDRFYCLLIFWVDRIKKQSIEADRDELASVAGLVFANCIDKFNYKRGRFSTYASTSFRNRLWVSVYGQLAHDPVYDVNELPELEAPNNTRRTSKAVQKQVKECLAKLTPVERMVVKRRFGIKHPSGQTFKEIANGIGLGVANTCEIYRRAMKKLNSDAVQLDDGQS